VAQLIAAVSGTNRFAANVVAFVRVLRAAGLPLGPAKVLDALAAVEAVGIDRRDDFQAALRAVLVNRREHQEVFDQAFELFWQNPRLAEKMMAMLLPRAQGRVDDPEHPDVSARVAQALVTPPPAGDGDSDAPEEVEIDAALSLSAKEVLQHKDFESMTAEELAQVRAMMAKLRLPLPRLVSRRYESVASGRRVHPRRTLQQTARRGAGSIVLAWRERRRITPPLVVLCDISGSMDRYARMLLYFLHAITNDRHRVHIFLFGTRLTNVTRHLRHRDVDVALSRVADAVEDWAGGTRIGASLDSDLADGCSELARETERLAKSCLRLVWLNPLLRYERFQAKPAGIRAMLPHVDAFLPVHNLESLAQLGEALNRVAHASRQPGAFRGLLAAA
jgi:uncharacterized protein with von Willebrand factor type A (vWA) domain